MMWSIKSESLSDPRIHNQVFRIILNHSMQESDFEYNPQEIFCSASLLRLELPRPAVCSVTRSSRAIGMCSGKNSQETCGLRWTKDGRDWNSASPVLWVARDQRIEDSWNSALFESDYIDRVDIWFAHPIWKQTYFVIQRRHRALVTMTSQVIQIRLAWGRAASGAHIKPKRSHPVPRTIEILSRLCTRRFSGTSANYKRLFQLALSLCQWHEHKNESRSSFPWPFHQEDSLVCSSIDIHTAWSICKLVSKMNDTVTLGNR